MSSATPLSVTYAMLPTSYFYSLVFALCFMLLVLALIFAAESASDVFAGLGGWAPGVFVTLIISQLFTTIWWYLCGFLFASETAGKVCCILSTISCFVFVVGSANRWFDDFLFGKRQRYRRPHDGWRD